MSKEHAYAYEAGYRDGAINYELDHCPACKNVADLQEALAENAKLRELVRDMHRAICGLVVLGDDYAGEYEDELCALDDRMSELGVEP